MDEKIQEEYNRLRAQGMQPAAALQQAKFNVRRSQEERQQSAPEPSDLPPGLGSPTREAALDALSVMANAGTLGAAGALSDEIAERVGFQRAESPGTTAALEIGTGALGGLGLARAGAAGLFGNTAARMFSPSGFAVTGPNLAQRAAGPLASAARSLSGPAGRAVLRTGAAGAGAGAGGVLASRLMDLLTGGR